MENQRPDSDDLTDEKPRPDAADTPEAGDADTDMEHPDDATGGGDCTGEEHSTRAGGRRFGGWLGGVVGAAATLFIASAAFAGTTLMPYLSDRAAVSTRLEIARTAAAAVTTLWTYTPETIDTLGDRAADYLSGDFHAQYRKFVNAVVTPNKQAQVTDNTEVVGVGVESLTGSQATAIVFTNTTATSPLTENIPSLKYIAYRLDMEREGSRWRVTNMATVSFMDLTPKL